MTTHVELLALGDGLRWCVVVLGAGTGSELGSVEVGSFVGSLVLVGTGLPGFVELGAGTGDEEWPPGRLW